MERLHVPVLNRSVSRLGMGSMIFSPERKGLVFELLDRFAKRGGNLIDSSEVYGGGRSEEAIGLYFAERGCRDDWVMLDKGCGTVESVTPENIRRAIRGNLDRLGIETIDLWLAHRDNPAVAVGDLVETLNEEVAAGRIRAWGGSNWTRERIDAAAEYAQAHGLIGPCCSSPNVCLARPNEPWWPDCTHASEADIAWSARTGIVLFAWSSQGRGFFLDDCAPENTANEALVRVYHSPENFERLRRARRLAAEKSLAPIQVALAYVLNLPAPIVGLVGPATIAEVDSCADAAAIELSDSEMSWLDLKLSDEAFAEARTR
ncbi:MAG: aldo/keto reductase [Planctomycetota bacterium]